jgi:hypothetical protein
VPKWGQKASITWTSPEFPLNTINS